MKRLITTTMVAACAAMAAHAQQQDITVKGRVDGLDTGQLYLIAQTGENKMDTLGSASFDASGFVLKGSYKEPIMAQIMVKGYTGGFSFIAEPGSTYDALLTNGEGFYIRGGKLNDEWTDFVKHIAVERAVVTDLRKQYEELKGQGKYRSASVMNDSVTKRQQQMVQETSEFFDRHDDLLAAFNAQTNAAMKGLGVIESQQLYDALGPGAKNTPSARIMKERIERMKMSEAGRKAPDFTLPDLKGDPLTLSKVPGKIKILDFWASWCGPCRLNNPALRSLYADYHDKGLEIIGVSLDNKKNLWEDAVKKDQLPWLHASSLKGWNCEVARKYNITAIPAIFILDEQNNIIATNLRGDKLRAFVADKLK